jgi:hypothetical protein
MSDPPDHPGYRVVNLMNAADLADAEAKGYRLAPDANPNVPGPVYVDATGALFLWAVMSQGYGH